MHTALVIGYGQIGTELAARLVKAGVRTTVATRSGPPSRPRSDHAEPTHVRVDATDRAQLLTAAENADAIFACAHAPYDSRKWAQILPRLDATIMDVAAAHDIPVVFPESVYAFAALDAPVTETSPYAPADAKGRIRRDLLKARAAHPARTASVIAGDLIGATAEPASSVVRVCITEPVARGRRAIVPARLDLPHGITVIADLASAMIRAADVLSDAPPASDRLFIAPTSNPTLREVVDFTQEHCGAPAKKSIAAPRWAVRLAGLVDRSMFELSELAPIFYAPCVVEPGDLADAVGLTDWRDGVVAMVGSDEAAPHPSLP